MVDTEVLNFLSNLINYTIFAFVFINILGTKCFSVNQMLITAVGLFLSFVVQLISVLIKKIK